MKIQPIIFNWKGQFKKVKCLEKQLKKYNPIVINSDEEHEKKKWINLGESAWYAQSFMKAVDVFMKDKKNQILLQIQGDISYDNWDSLIEDSIRDYKTFIWGIYAPNATWTEWNAARTNIPEISTGIPGIRHVACTDCIVWMIHRNIIQSFLDLKIDMSDQILGFGIDMIMCGISHQKNKPVLRNYNHQVNHPRSTNYNITQAHIEMGKLFNRIPHEMKQIVAHIYRNPSYLSRFHNLLDR